MTSGLTTRYRGIETRTYDVARSQAQAAAVAAGRPPTFCGLYMDRNLMKKVAFCQFRAAWRTIMGLA
jgi:hypothetical protein